ncbi:MAG TPA: glycosyltransferase family 4 protein [Candidatus Limnocylindria bacterium]|nr:glycosyltransferase family 4 protein [Candidatus Limnocylindria bacterium]
MRVAFLTHNYPRYAGDLSGAFLSTLARALVARGVEVTVIAPSDRGDVGEPMDGPVPVRRVRYAGARHETLAYAGTMADAARTVAGLRALTALRSALRHAAEEAMAAGADLLHAHWWVPAGLSVPRGRPYVLTSHGTDAALLSRSALARRLARPVYRKARLVTAVSNEMALRIQRATGRAIPPGHIHAMPADTSRYGWSEGGDGAIVVARLTAQKRVDLAIRAIGVLATLGARLPLTVVGDGPERPALEQLATELGVSADVRFVGALATTEIPAILRRADLMYFPAVGEGFGLAAAEALMSGVPVVACWDGGGVLDIVPETGAGRRVIPSADALADATLDLLADDQRVYKARELGQAWRAKLRPENVAATVEQWYREALGE